MTLSDRLWADILDAHLQGSPPPSGAGALGQLLGRDFTVAQVGQSLDGRVATVTGHSHYVNGAPALRHLHALRALSDVVLVGVGTVVADDPQLTVRRLPGPNPARAVIDPHGRAPLHARCFAEDGARRLLLRTVDAPSPSGVEVALLPGGQDGRIDPALILATLAALGFRRVLVEGGPATVSAFLTAGVLDRLHVLVAPVLIGSGFPALTLPPIQTMDEAFRPAIHPYLLGEGEVLFDCNLRMTA